MNKYTCFNILLAISTIPISIFGAVFHCIDTTTPLKCTLSSNHHNRIVVDAGEIRKVISADPGLSITMEPESGQAFVYSLLQNPKETALSVVTKGGHVQDIEISFEERSPEVIILIEPILIEEEVEVVSEREEIATSDQIIDVLLAGGVPTGYYLCEIDREISELRAGLWVEAVSMIRSSKDDIYVYQIVNKSHFSQEITEKELAGCDSRWVYLGTRKIKSKGRTMAIVSYNMRAE